MSEYQFYRFERIDGYLESKQRQQLRNISSRAEITSTSFQVCYHFGDLKADIPDFVLNYFDIGLCYASWGSIDAYIKLPMSTLPEAMLHLNDRRFNVYKTDQWQLLILSIEGYYDDFYDEQAIDFFQHLAALRAELMQGDWRLLYFMWLRALDNQQPITPMPMIGFDFNTHSLSAAQRAFIDLFDIPLALVKALVFVLAEHPSHRPNYTPFNPSDWLRQLSETQKNQLLTLVIEQGQLTCHQALTLTRQDQASKPIDYQHWLSAHVIEPYMETADEQFQQEQAAALAQRQAAEKQAKQATLTAIYNGRDLVWQQIEEEANRTCASGYDHASSDLQQLAEAYQYQGDYAAFKSLLNDFLLRHNKRKALLTRLKKLSVCA